LAGPTKFTNVLQAFNTFAKQQGQQNIYSVLLILTDGEIHDMQAVKELIV
jgi:hypothetical protein